MSFRGSWSALLAVFLLGGVISSTATAVGSSWGDFGEATTTSSGLHYRYSASERAFFVEGPTPDVGEASSGVGPDLEWRRVERCSAHPDFIAWCDGALCMVDGTLGFRVDLYSRPAGDPDAVWQHRSTYCSVAPRRIDLADVEQAAQRALEDRYKEIARPRIGAAPHDAALVNLPVLAWTEDTPPVTLSITQPLPGSITAVPSFAWEWSNGDTSTGPGRPFDPGIDPVSSPASYVATTFDQPGTSQVSLTATWTATFEVPGVASVPLSPLTYTQTRAFPVREATTVLVDGAS